MATEKPLTNPFKKEQGKFSLIIPVYKTTKHLEVNLEHLNDQDLEHLNDQHSNPTVCLIKKTVLKIWPDDTTYLL